jgi:hypothetical protein
VRVADAARVTSPSPWSRRMTIHFIPNDPRASAQSPPMRRKARRPDRPASRSGFTFGAPPPEGLAQPGTAQFLFWQMRDAAIAAIDAWEAAAGPHTAWQGGRRRIKLLPDVGEDLNAFYDRESFSFFHMKVKNATYYSGASTDVVAHEIGHGLLDSVRPEFFDVNFLEVGAFHEAFGDCIAILTALADIRTRRMLIAAAPNLRRRNFVASIAEELAHGIKAFEPTHNGAVPRHAFNRLRYQIPSTLPDDGGPGVLINEVHSFGMIFTGCFWDLIANLYAAAPKKTEAALARASVLAGELLIAGAKSAVITPRFLQSVGRAMTLADEALHGGAHRVAIRDAFGRHDILLGSNAMLAPTAALAGAAPRGAALAASTRRDLRQRLGNTRGARLDVSAENVFGTPVVKAVQLRHVELGALHPMLKGVAAEAREPVLVGATGKRAAVLGAMPHADDTDGEVLAFVQSLLAHGRIEMPAAKKQRGVAAVSRSGNAAIGRPTHAIGNVGGRKVLQRLRFQCGCGCVPR